MRSFGPWWVTWVFALAAPLAACRCGYDMHMIGRDGDGGADARIPPPGRSELCGNGMDDDRNGRIDDGCPCAPGETQACFGGDYPSRGVGACRDGVQTCVAGGVGREWGDWGDSPCVGDVRPMAEMCDGMDRDCDGVRDEGCPCSEGESRACGEAFGMTGPCMPGTQRCAADGRWGTTCEGAVGPMAEVCGNGVDDDCDGATDPARLCSCVPVPEICGNGVDDDCDGTIDEPEACSATCIPVVEVCGDGVDQDCDGMDEPCPAPDGGTDDSGIVPADLGMMPPERSCRAPADCLAGSVCEFETGRCVPVPGRCGARPDGAPTGTKRVREPCQFSGGRSNCASDLTCVVRAETYGIATREYIACPEDDRAGLCAVPCDPCAPSCPEGLNCFALASGGGACLPAMLPAGASCLREYAMGTLTLSWVPCEAGSVCFPAPTGGLMGVCRQTCVPEDETYIAGDADVGLSVSASASCTSDGGCRLFSISGCGTEEGRTFICEREDRIAETGTTVFPGDTGKTLCRFPARPAGRLAPAPTVCSPPITSCTGSPCPPGLHCRSLGTWVAGDAPVYACVAEGGVSAGGICGDDRDCMPPFRCQGPIPSTLGGAYRVCR
jgi:hypothetical protein